jgi:hypothetical protein
LFGFVVCASSREEGNGFDGMPDIENCTQCYIFGEYSLKEGVEMLCSLETDPHLNRIL